MDMKREDMGDGGANARGADRAVTDRIAARAHEAVDRAADKSGAAEHQIREKAQQASEQLRRSEERVREVAGESARQVERFLERNPLMGVGLAFVAGLAISALLRR
jgi:ElaB/YqjD/DUF883 family membrane-anchored ribosome-binding protein